MSKYDDASWHYEGDFPEDLQPLSGATHIGMLLTWIIEMDLYSEEVAEDCSEELKAVKEKTMTGATCLMQCFDGTLSDFELNDAGNEFISAYYDDETTFSRLYASYLQDYTNELNADARYESLYYIEDSWDNYAILKPIISQRFEEWKEFNEEV
jgi:hypothetical protein